MVELNSQPSCCAARVLTTVPPQCREQMPIFSIIYLIIICASVKQTQSMVTAVTIFIVLLHRLSQICLVLFLSDQNVKSERSKQQTINSGGCHDGYCFLLCKEFLENDVLTLSLPSESCLELDVQPHFNFKPSKCLQRESTV